MSLAFKKQEPQPSGVQQQQHIHVDRDAVNTASRQTSVTINQMTDQIFREISKELEKKQR